MKKIFIFLSLVLVLFASSRALLHSEFFRVHDYIHVARLAEMDRALSDGHVPVRWSENFGFGYGMPLFSFYAPLPSYVGMIFVWLGLSYVQAVRMLFFLASLITVTGGYFLGKVLWKSRSAGVVTATLITLAPYRAVNLYIRGALSEAWGIAFLPLILLGVVLVFRQEKKGVYLTAIAVAGMLLSHNLVSLMFLPIVGLFIVGYAFLPFLISRLEKKELLSVTEQLHSIKKIALSFIWGAALSLFYVLPAFFEKDATKVEQAVTGGYFDYHLHFLYIRQFFDTAWGYGGSEWGPTDSISFSLGIPQILMMSLSLTVVLSFIYTTYFQKQKKKFYLFAFLYTLYSKIKFIMPRNSRSSIGGQIRVWLNLPACRQASLRNGVFLSEMGIVRNKQEHARINLTASIALICLSGLLLLVTLYMSLTKSLWLWESVSLLSFIQFPWRWLSVAIILVGIIGSSSIVFMKRKSRYLLTLFIVLFSVVTAWDHFLPEEFLDTSDSFYYSDEDRIQRQMSEILFDYQPAQMALPLVPPAELVSQSDGAEFESSIVVDRVHQKAINVSVTQPGNLQVAIAAFPGWEAYVNGEEVQWQQAQDGTMMVPVDQESEIVSFDYQGTLLQKISNTISLLAVFLLLVPLIKTYGIKREFING